ncbi:MAG: hypothetical protein Q4F60_02695 [Candidatus Saccharibacteria bacterium]|nr:hypothetical protein [Candidatus Saccharibacteria bacterium]
MSTPHPLTIRPLFLHIIIVFAVFSILVSILKFFLTTFTPDDPATAENFTSALSFIRHYLNPVTVWLRIIILIFSIYATIIYILNPHPYTRHAIFVSWLATFLAFTAMFLL